MHTLLGIPHSAPISAALSSAGLGILALRAKMSQPGDGKMLLLNRRLRLL